LDKRREKRVSLAELKKKRDLALAVSTRIGDEDGIWSWWMVSAVSPFFHFLFTEHDGIHRFKRIYFNLNSSPRMLGNAVVSNVNGGPSLIR
jgi:hypothetical protein